MTTICAVYIMDCILVELDSTVSPNRAHHFSHRIRIEWFEIVRGCHFENRILAISEADGLNCSGVNACYNKHKTALRFLMHSSDGLPKWDEIIVPLYAEPSRYIRCNMLNFIEEYH